MRTKIFFGLWVAFVASFISVRADDNPSQAAARAALEQKLNDLDNPQTRPAPGTTSGAAAVQPGESATNATDTVPAKAVTPQTAPAATTPVAAPAAAAPAATVQPVATPAIIQPAAALATPKPAPAPAAAKPSSPPVKAKPANEIATTTGVIYENTQVEKVEPDGIIISYTLAGGGLAMTKVYFNELSAELRQRYKKE